MNVRGTWATFLFDARRFLAPMRLLLWIAAAIFPTGVALLVTTGNSDFLEAEGQLANYLYLVVVSVICPLGVLLWAAPIVQGELEGKTWTYIAVRPGARTAVLIGKYCAAVVWTTLSAWAGTALAIVVLGPEVGVGEAASLAWTIGQLALAGTAGFGAMYTLLGVLFLKRSMVICVGYTLLVEVALSLVVRANISTFTLQYRLRSLLLDDVPELEWLKGFANSEAATSFQYAAILLHVIIPLALAVFVLRQRQLVLAEQDV